MRLLTFTQGPWGERIFRNINERRPGDWTMRHIELPRSLPALIDDPEEIIPQELPQTDLILFMSESPQAPQLIPDLAQTTGARGIIAPIDNSAWLPTGLKNQIQKDLSRLGVASAFPKTFCTLTEERYGYRHSAERYDSDVISAFARHFGRPILTVTVNPQTKIIEAVEVHRGAPCGSTHHAAAGMIGLSADEAVPKAGLICHHYPCQASMQQEQIDKALFETLMHLSGYVLNEEVEQQVKPFRTPTRYLNPMGE